MNTYILEAPDYAQVDDIPSDVRFFYAERAGHARDTAAEIWHCDPADIMLLVAFRGKCADLPAGRGAVNQLNGVAKEASALQLCRALLDDLKTALRYHTDHEQDCSGQGCLYCQHIREAEAILARR